MLRAERLNGVTQGVHEPRCALGRVLARPEHRHDHVLGLELEVHVIELAHQLRDTDAGAPRAPNVHREPQGIPIVDSGAPDKPLVQNVESGDSTDGLACPLDPRDGLGQELGSPDRRLAARCIQRGGEQCARAGGLREGDAAVDYVGVDQLVAAQVQDRRLGEAAEQLVDRGEHQVGATLERAVGQLLGEAHMRAPCLVDDQGHAALVRHAREPAHVRDRAEVGGRHGERGDRVRTAVERPGEGPRRQAVGDAELSVELGGYERRLEPGEHDAVHGARVHVSLRDDLASGMAQRETGGVVSLRGAADQEPAAPRSPCLRGEPLGPLKRRVRPDVDPLDSRRDVVLERSLAQCRDELGVRALAALVPRNVKPPGVARGVGDDGIEIRRLPLIEPPVGRGFPG